MTSLKVYKSISMASVNILHDMHVRMSMLFEVMNLTQFWFKWQIRMIEPTPQTTPSWQPLMVTFNAGYAILHLSHTTTFTDTWLEN